MLAFIPGEVIGPLKDGVPACIRTVSRISESRKSRELDKGDSPVERILQYVRNTQLGNDVVAARVEIAIDSLDPAQSELELVYLVWTQHQRMAEHALMRYRAVDRTLIRYRRRNILRLIAM